MSSLRGIAVGNHHLHSPAPAVTRRSWRSEVAASFSGQNSCLMAHYTFTELTRTSHNKAADFGVRGLQETGLVSGSRLSC